MKTLKAKTRVSDRRYPYEPEKIDCNDEMNANPLLISHVPKTAGASLKHMVAQTWPDAVFVYKGEISLLNSNVQFMQEFRRRAKPPIVMGHFSFGAHRFLGVSPRYAIVLREPLARVISLYRYQRSLPDSPFSEFFKIDDSLGGFVRSGVTEMTNNHMCRMIAGVAPDSGKIIHDRWLLDHAVHNLKTFYEVVGIQERMDLFLDRLAEAMGVDNLKISKENVTQWNEIELDVKTEATVREMNLLDDELYKIVRLMSLKQDSVSIHGISTS